MEELGSADSEGRGHRVRAKDGMTLFSAVGRTHFGTTYLGSIGRYQYHLEGTVTLKPGGKPWSTVSIACHCLPLPPSPTPLRTAPSSLSALSALSASLCLSSSTALLTLPPSWYLR